MDTLEPGNVHNDENDQPQNLNDTETHNATIEDGQSGSNAQAEGYTTAEDDDSREIGDDLMLHKVLLEMEEDGADDEDLKKLSEMLVGMRNHQINALPEGANGTAIHFAAKKGLASATEKLLESGADIEAKDRNGNTPLCIACEHGKIKVITLLLESKAEPRVLHHKGSGLLQMAVDHKFPEVVDILLKKGVGLDSTVENWNSPLRMAMDSKNEKIIDILLEDEKSRKALLDTPDILGYTPLTWAARFSDEKGAARLLEAGAQPNAYGPSQRTPLMFACGSNCIGMVSLLFDQPNLQLDAQDELGNTALHYACSKDCYDSVSALLKHGANIRKQNNEGRQPFHLVQSQPVSDLLIQSGAGRVATDIAGDTAL